MRSPHVQLSELVLLALHVALVTGRPGGSGAWADEVQKQATFGTDAHFEPQRHPYGFWESPFSPEWMVNQPNSIDDVFVDPVDAQIYYSEIRSTEGGRNILRKVSTREAIFDGPWDARTAVHEYGGGYAVAHNGTVYFSNLKDNRVYQVLPGGTPTPVTPARSEWRFADFTVHPVYPRFLVAIREDHSMTDCILNTPVLIDTETGLVRSTSINVATQPPPGSPCSYPPGPEFFDTPRFSPDGEHFLLRAWYHPYMSWESSEIWLSDIEPIIDSSGELLTLQTSNLRPIIGEGEELAVGEPNWINADTFMFTNDIDGYINPWIYDLPTSKARPLLPSVIKEDFGQATWWFGMSHNAVLDEEHILSTSFRDGRSQFYVIKISDGTTRKLRVPLAYVSYVRRVADGKVVFLGRTDTTSQTVWDMTFTPRTPGAALDERSYELRPLVPLGLTEVPPEYISLPTAYTLKHPTTGDPIHAIYWPPTNPKYAGGLPGELPPVVVNVHGGPTHMVWQGLNWETQLFTSRGFGWLSVNYGGSMTYGVEYRKRLLGNWGIVDVRDSVEAVKQLGELGILDLSRAVIRGGSAGGFTTFAALATVPDFFAAGMSMFGVSDLRTLQAAMHKFESHYLLKYVGGTPETDPELWWERSPVSKAANIKSPLLILQGAEDTVVPVDQAVDMLETIKKHGGRAELHIFEGEGHGWRQAKTLQEALKREIDWYKNVLRGNASWLA
ncbi:alpha/beta-hydrolase [Lentinus tigrinus ALCF2SS1-7]|uniref:Alpha/beta-hydrolase n=1 Tax=Lentinus tigrinus ALCF2SS1-6 TaxID=1328759 RepID=A0A5C2SQ63_9APHY|nr:alpha/beta-hydrolase [Lentinus tigrinus ALCF2SS1-6]RPD78961.1 alpha/beta-hydrolase [Lentinus tigrinus ALCF2SS1-7]